jgi:hypothetical protein
MHGTSHPGVRFHQLGFARRRQRDHRRAWPRARGPQAGPGRLAPIRNLMPRSSGTYRTAALFPPNMARSTSRASSASCRRPTCRAIRAEANTPRRRPAMARDLGWVFHWIKGDLQGGRRSAVGQTASPPSRGYRRNRAESSQPHDLVEPCRAGLGHRRLDRAPMKMAGA